MSETTELIKISPEDCESIELSGAHLDEVPPEAQERIQRGISILPA